MTPRELLRSGAEELGASLSAEQVNSLFLYLAELRKWNRRINLTAITGERESVVKHMLDSLSYGKGFAPAPGQRLLDMGSGAGFPAIPLKIVHPGLIVLLVESVKKKASFLRHVARTLALDGIEVMDVRIGELADSYHGVFDIVTARAFADMKTALIEGSPFLKTGGLMVLSRGPGESIAEGEPANYGVTLEKKVALRLPHSEYKRVIWIFKKTV